MKIISSHTQQPILPKANLLFIQDYYHFDFASYYLDIKETFYEIVLASYKHIYPHFLNRPHNLTTPNRRIIHIIDNRSLKLFQNNVYNYLHIYSLDYYANS